MQRARHGIGALARSLVARTLTTGVLWWILTEGRPGGVVPSGLVVLASTLSSYWMIAPGGAGWRPQGLLRFVPFFLVQSVRGGVDVALRAFHPRLPILTGLVDYPLRIPDGLPRVFFINALSLLPGTVSAELRGDRLTVHLLDRRLSTGGRIEALEDRVAALFGVAI